MLWRTDRRFATECEHDSCPPINKRGCNGRGDYVPTFDSGLVWPFLDPHRPIWPVVTPRSSAKSLFDNHDFQQCYLAISGNGRATGYQQIAMQLVHRAHCPPALAVLYTIPVTEVFPIYQMPNRIINRFGNGH